MSYIHDALKASSEQRKAVQGGGDPASEMPPPPESEAKSRWSLGRILLILLLGLLLFWFWRSFNQPSVITPVDNHAPEIVTPESADPATEEPDLSGVKIEIRKEPVRPPAPPQPVPAQPRTPQQSARVEQPPASGSEAQAPQEEARSGPYANLPYLRQLPVEQQRELKGIRFTVHIYSDEPGSRMVKYEDRVLREGYFVRPGVRIEAIIPRGVVLRYQDTRFKVPAL